MANVAFVHPLMKALAKQYELIRDCLAGEQQVKFRRTKYLPVPNAADTSPENLARYDAYLTRAVFYNVAQRTLAGLIGQVFLRDPAVKVPTILQNVIDDATGSGVPLDQLAQEAGSYAMAYGRTGLYVDYPDTAEPASRAEIDAGDIRPTIKVIPPWDGINYRVVRRGAKIILSLVVFREDWIEEDDGFETKVKDQWRVLRLDANGEYVVEIYRNKVGVTPDVTYFPQDAAGKRLTEIPFSFIGAMNNDPEPGIPPLYDLCSLNIAHYRNSADYEENVYFIGQPTPWFAGLTEEWVDKVMKGAVALGARGGILLPEQGSAGILQVQPNTLAKEAMDQKEAQMLALGAKLVEGSQVQRTATEADIDNTSETSILSSVAKNVGSGFKWALEWCSVFVGATEEGIEYDLNTEFDLVNMTPEERNTLLKEWQAGGIDFEEYRDNLRRAGIATKTDAEAKASIDKEQADSLARAVEEVALTTKATTENGPPPPKGAPPKDK